MQGLLPSPTAETVKCPITPPSAFALRSRLKRTVSPIQYDTTATQKTTRTSTPLEKTALVFEWPDKYRPPRSPRAMSHQFLSGNSLTSWWLFRCKESRMRIRKIRLKLTYSIGRNNSLQQNRVLFGELIFRSQTLNLIKRAVFFVKSAITKDRKTEPYWPENIPAPSTCPAHLQVQAL